MAFLHGLPVLIFAILGIHVAYGCNFVNAPGRLAIEEVVNDGDILFTLEVDGDIEYINTNPQSDFSNYIYNETNGKNKIDYKARSAAIAAFYDERNRSSNYFSIIGLVVSCVGDPIKASIASLGVSVTDKNNKPPEFDRPDDTKDIKLPWGSAPINWDNSIIVTDGDFEESNTNVIFTMDPEGIILIEAERFPPSPGRLNYYNVFYTLDPNYDQTKADDVSIIVTADDGVFKRELVVNLAITPAISPPTITEDSSYHTEAMKNSPNERIEVAIVEDNGGIDALNVQVTPPNNFDVEIDTTTGQVSLILRDEFDPKVLDDENYIVRLTLDVSDATNQIASLPLAIRFERIVVEAELVGRGYVLVEKSDPARALLTVSATPADGVEYQLVDPNGKISINPNGEVLSAHSDDEILDLDGEVQVYEVIVKRLDIAEVKLKIAVVYKADSSLITTTTSTTETPVTCPTITTPADCVYTTLVTETVTPPVTTDETLVTCPTHPPCPTDPGNSTGNTCEPCDCTTTMASTSSCEPCTTTVGNTAATDPSSTACPPCDSSTASPVTGGPTAVTGSSDSTCPPPSCPPSDCSTASPVTGGPTAVTGSSDSTSTPCDCSTASPVTGGPTAVTDSSDSTCPPPSCPPSDCSTASPVTGGPTAVTSSSDSTSTPCDCSTASAITDGQTASTDCPVVTCPPTSETPGPACPPEDCTTSGLIAGVAVASTIAVASAGIAAFLAWKAWSGVNVFKDLITTTPKYPDPEVGPKGTSGGSVRNAFENGTVRSNFNGSLKGSARNGVISNGFGSVKGMPDTKDITYQNDTTYDTTGEYSYANPDPDITTSEMTPDAMTEVTKSSNNNDSISQPELPPETDPPPEEPKPDYNRVTIAEEPPTVIPVEPAEETLD